MPYTTVIDADFSGQSDTAYNTGADATVALGFKAHIDNTWAVKSGKLNLDGAGAGTPGNGGFNSSVPGNTCYYGGGSTFQDGRATIYLDRLGSPAASFRFDPSDGTGYAAMLYGSNQFLLWPEFSAVSLANAVPTHAKLVVAWTQTDPTTTQIVMSIVDIDTGITTDTHTYNSTASALQNRSGRAGVSAYGDGDAKRIFLESYVAGGGPLTAGTESTDTSDASKADVSRTKVRLTTTTPSGGSGTGYTYQHQKSADGGTTWTNVSGATSRSYTVTGLTPATTYKFRCLYADDATGTATSNVITVTTYASTDPIFCFAPGDSIENGTGAATPSNAWWKTFLATLRDKGIACTGVMLAASGSVSGDWTGTSWIATATDSECDTYLYALGTNDSQISHAVTATQYDTNVGTTLTNIEAATGFRRVLLMEIPYVVPGTAGLWDATSDTLIQAYNVKLVARDNGTTVRYLATGAFKWFRDTHPEQMTGVHPDDNGHLFLGVSAANGYQKALLGNPTYASASDVRLNTDRGDGVLGTAYIAPPATGYTWAVPGVPRVGEQLEAVITPTPQNSVFPAGTTITITDQTDGTTAGYGIASVDVSLAGTYSYPVTPAIAGAHTIDFTSTLGSGDPGETTVTVAPAYTGADPNVVIFPNDNGNNQQGTYVATPTNKVVTGTAFGPHSSLQGTAPAGTGGGGRIGIRRQLTRGR